jgi:NADH-quinone oxidoreductase subunit G
VPGAATPVGESRPGWKVLRVLGNLLDLSKFDYLDSEQVRDELESQLAFVKFDNALVAGSVTASTFTSTVNSDVPMYAVDALVRRSPALQATPEALGQHPRAGHQE